MISSVSYTLLTVSLHYQRKFDIVRHLHWLIRDVNAMEARIQNEKFLPTVGLEPTTSGLLDWRSDRLSHEYF